MPKRLSSVDILRRLQEDTDSDGELSVEEEDSVQEEEGDTGKYESDSDSSNDSEIDEESESESSNIVFRSCEGTVWKMDPPPHNVRQSARNILHHTPGPKQYILLRIDNAIDVFLELVGHEQLLYVIASCTIAAST